MGITTIFCGDAWAQKHVSDLDLLGNATSSSFYAADHYLCLGYGPRQARRAARAALGNGFNARLSHAARQLEKRYDKQAVAQRTELIAIGYKMTPKRCRAVRDIVRKARTDLATLERRLQE